MKIQGMRVRERNNITSLTMIIKWNVPFVSKVFFLIYDIMRPNLGKKKSFIKWKYNRISNNLFLIAC